LETAEQLILQPDRAESIHMGTKWATSRFANLTCVLPAVFMYVAFGKTWRLHCKETAPEPVNPLTK